MIDVLLLVILGGVTYCVAGEVAWGAAITCLSVILSGLIAMNFFEPICDLFGGDPFWNTRLDLIVLVGLFAAGVSGLRFGADYFSPTYIGVHRMVHEGARWGCAVLSGYVTMAFLLTALHTSALPREFLGFAPERANFFAIAPDRQWLGFTQWVTENVCNSSPPRIFDGPRIVLGDPGTKAEVENKIWPSFPIRYASRREKGGGGGGAVAPPAPVRQVAPPPKQGASGF